MAVEVHWSITELLFKIILLFILLLVSLLNSCFSKLKWHFAEVIMFLFCDRSDLATSDNSSVDLNCLHLGKLHDGTAVFFKQCFLEEFI